MSPEFQKIYLESGEAGNKWGGVGVITIAAAALMLVATCNYTVREPNIIKKKLEQAGCTSIRAANNKYYRRRIKETLGSKAGTVVFPLDKGQEVVCISYHPSIKSDDTRTRCGLRPTNGESNHFTTVQFDEE